MVFLSNRFICCFVCSKFVGGVIMPPLVRSYCLNAQIRQINHQTLSFSLKSTTVSVLLGLWLHLYILLFFRFFLCFFLLYFPTFLVASPLILVLVFHPSLDVFELFGEGGFGMFVLEMLLVGFRVGHLSHALGALVNECRVGRCLLTCSLLEPGGSFGVFLLSLDFLLSTSHCLLLLLLLLLRRGWLVVCLFVLALLNLK